MLSEVKLEVETVIKTGRQIVQKQQTENPKAMDDQLTALKLLYNDLGAQVAIPAQLVLHRKSDSRCSPFTFFFSLFTGYGGQAGPGKSSVSFSKIPEGGRHPAGVAYHQRSSAAGEEQLWRHAS